MRNKFALVLGLAITWLGCSKEIFEQPVRDTKFPQAYKSDHTLGLKINSIIQEYSKKGLPGISVAIADGEGVWEGAAGYARIEDNQPMSNGGVHAGGSVSKIYTATAIMMLHEQQKLQLDRSIDNYLPRHIAGKIKGAGNITVRMLLSHRSGIPDYIADDNFRLHWFNDLSQRWDLEKILKFVNRRNYLEPDAAYQYSNTNYVLLSLIIEHVGQRQEGEWMSDNVFHPNGLKYTFYKNSKDFLDGFAMPNFYMDRFGDGRLQNVSLPTRVEIYSEYGDGGLVATSLDFVSFMQSLTKHKIIGSKSLEIMSTPTKESEYGLGLDLFNYGKKLQFGHQGAVFGGSSLLLYFKEQELALFIAANCDATLVGGKTLHLFHEMKNRICELVAAVSS